MPKLTTIEITDRNTWNIALKQPRQQLGRHSPACLCEGRQAGQNCRATSSDRSRNRRRPWLTRCQRHTTGLGVVSHLRGHPRPHRPGGVLSDVLSLSKGACRRELEEAAQGSQAAIDRGGAQTLGQLLDDEVAHIGPGDLPGCFVDHPTELLQIVLVVDSGSTRRVALLDMFDETLHGLCKVLIHCWPSWFHYATGGDQLYVSRRVRGLSASACACLYASQVIQLDIQVMGKHQGAEVDRRRKISYTRSVN
ncbi:MAG: hypothetical protein MAG451_01259 [Anaerolineales bacterium]|nr:hypothetical protein [Anaerolineales bacterium]